MFLAIRYAFFISNMRQPARSTLFPYTTLFRSRERDVAQRAEAGTPVDARRFLHLRDRKSTRLNSSHVKISYAVFCLKKKFITQNQKAMEPKENTSTIRTQGITSLSQPNAL